MTSRFFGFVVSMSSSEQKLWFPNQNVQDPDTWTLSHLLQLKQEYLKLVSDFNCDIQELVTVQDPPAPLSDTLHLSPLILHSATAINMDLLQSGENTTGHVNLSTNHISSAHEVMTNLTAASNTLMIEQLALHTPVTIHATNEHDLNPRPCAVNDHPSVLAHEMMTTTS